MDIILHKITTQDLPENLASSILSSSVQIKLSNSLEDTILLCNTGNFQAVITSLTKNEADSILVLTERISNLRSFVVIGAIKGRINSFRMELYAKLGLDLVLNLKTEEPNLSFDTIVNGIQRITVGMPVDKFPNWLCPPKKVANRQNFWPEKLKPKEIAVLIKLIAHNGDKAKAAATLNISQETLYTHLKNIRQKMGVSSTDHLLIEAMKGFGKLSDYYNR